MAGGSRIPVQLSGGRREALLVAVTVRREAAVAAAPVVAVRGKAVKRRRRKVKLLTDPSASANETLTAMRHKKVCLKNKFSQC